ncbi:MAG: hypothetical protein BM557_01205 [Flavobacterium sp. MedPE-SWcel]|uniref:hypothetical protein n=1 Tax=uncultured Flavobacterium sp. TaxID=165435 RepID=UPI000921D2ED|nr:hypothetical protein [uncultured Flavobacterium sp.]OIQ22025.1 MAG: hypothetical protein BM557_01205 [Flavobacterium sp. MedPE-SWcel]
MKNLFLKVLNIMRFTGFDWIDHAIGAVLLFVGTFKSFCTVGVNAHFSAVTAALFTSLVVVCLEIWQGKTKNGVMEVSDMMSGIIATVVTLTINFMILDFSGHHISGFSFWGGVGALVFILPFGYPFVWMQLRASERKRFLALFKKS